ncbi:MAG: Ig-like domain-containing protein [Deltaproteobacteria bacterium]|nr:Ig-like domain-containing protein [Deltaproteobacteria bacterium]
MNTPDTPAATNSLDAATGVTLDETFKYTFSPTIVVSTISASNYFIVPTPSSGSLTKGVAINSICNVSNKLNATVSCVHESTTTTSLLANSCTLTPATNLEYLTSYTLCLLAGKDGGPFYSDQGVSWPFEGFMATFTTIAGPTFTISPTGGATNVALNTTLSATASAVLATSTLTTSNVSVKPSSSSDGTANVCTSISYDSTTNRLTCVHGDLAPGIKYTMTITTDVTDSSENNLENNITSSFTTTSTSGDNNSTSKIVLPSFDGTGGTSLAVSFAKAMDSASFTSGSIKVTTATDINTNLCSSIGYNTDSRQATCALSGRIECDTTPTKYLVTVNADPKTSDGSHAAVPFSGYFSNLDDGFNNSSTIGPGACWTVTAGINDNGDDPQTATSEVVNANTTSAGMLTFQGQNNLDISDEDDDENARLTKSSINLGDAFGIVLRINSLTGVGNGESVSSVFRLANNNEVSLNLGGTATGFQYGGGVSNSNVESQTSAVTAGTPLYLCMTRNSNGTTSTVAFNENATSNAFTGIDLSSLTIPILADPISIEIQFAYSANNMTIQIDWLRFNIGEASCPAVTDVE